MIDYYSVANIRPHRSVYICTDMCATFLSTHFYLGVVHGFLGHIHVGTHSTVGTVAWHAFIMAIYVGTYSTVGII